MPRQRIVVVVLIAVQVVVGWVGGVNRHYTGRGMSIKVVLSTCSHELLAAIRYSYNHLDMFISV